MLKRFSGKGHRHIKDVFSGIKLSLVHYMALITYFCHPDVVNRKTMCLISLFQNIVHLLHKTMINHVPTDKTMVL